MVKLPNILFLPCQLKKLLTPMVLGTLLLEVTNLFVNKVFQMLI